MRHFQLLEDAELARVREYLEEAAFRDGRETAHGQSRAVKSNEEIDLKHPVSQEMTAYLATRVMAHPNTQWLVYPKTLTRPIVSRTAGGGSYGQHIDASQMQDIHGRQMRTDLSFTLFLSPPETYDGGELRIRAETGAFVDFKLPAGAIIFYDAARLHEVMPVTSGERLACIGWIESMIYDGAVRDAMWSLMEMQTELGRHVDKSSEIFQSYQLAVNALRRSLIGRV